MLSSAICGAKDKIHDGGVGTKSRYLFLVSECHSRGGHIVPTRRKEGIL